MLAATGLLPPRASSKVTVAADPQSAFFSYQEPPEMRLVGQVVPERAEVVTTLQVAAMALEAAARMREIVVNCILKVV